MDFPDTDDNPVAPETPSMAAPGRLLPEGVVPPAGGALDAKGSISAFLTTLKCVELPALATRCWVLSLADGAKVFIFEETLGPENFACDCCRIVGERGFGRPAGRACKTPSGPIGVPWLCGCCIFMKQMSV